MKKVKNLLYLLACTGLLFTACNNGDYNADPNSNLSDIPNPFKYGGATVGGPGYLKANFNEQEIVFSPAKWMDMPGMGRGVAAMRMMEDGWEEVVIMFNSAPSAGDSVFNASVNYAVYASDSTLKAEYDNNFTSEVGFVMVTGFDWYKLTGRFQAALDQNFPVDSHKVVVLTQGYFDTGKQ